MADHTRIQPERDLREILLNVQMPGRYVGGELGAVRKDGEGLLDVGVSYPDLYEVGMSNLAVKVLYGLLNGVDRVRCERVFAVAPDFEAALRSAGVPLYTLETGIPLGSLDVLGFSIGYELTLTNVLAILDLGGIPIRAADRGGSHPIVIAGGPAVTNPAPLGRFVDCVFIGEAEGWAERVFGELARLKAQGAGRSVLLDTLRAEEHIWYPGKENRARRSVWMGFGEAAHAASGATGSRLPPFPVSSIKCVQDEGTVEIMRGCPNGCRFCHAGVLYRPFRVKPPEQVVREIDELVFGAGYDEVTLASLSSGDYPGLVDLVGFLNTRYATFGVSFSLPSLRVSSVALELMAGLSEVRKSGLTFAVETPLEEHQRSVNKLAPLERVIDLLMEAKGKGWRKAKFYFMIGLPQTFDGDEAEAIAAFIRRVRARTGMDLNVNIGTFVPKPHTPFQWARQLGEAEALERINQVRRSVGRGGAHIGYQAPFISFMEGVIARGDDRAAALVEEAYRRGARLDAWDEYQNWDLWRGVYAQAGWDVEAELKRGREQEEALPWDGVSLGVSRAFLSREWHRAETRVETAVCAASCGESCGVCGQAAKVRDRGWSEEDRDSLSAALPSVPHRSAGAAVAEGVHPSRVVFSFRKDGKAAFLSHLNLMTVLARAFRRAGLAARLTEGFNPKPRLEIASPLPLGLESDAEIGAVELYDFPGEAELVRRVSAALPAGLAVTGAGVIPDPAPNVKRRSLMAEVWGGDYRIDSPSPGVAESIGRADPGLVTKTWTAGEAICFRLRQSGEGGAGVLKVLAALTGTDALKAGMRLRRLQILRRGGTGGPEPMVAPSAQ